MKKILTIFIRLFFISFILFSCGKKSYDQNKVTPKVILKVPVEVDFFIDTTVRTLKILDNQGKNEIYSVENNTCKTMVSIKKEKSNFIVSLFNNSKKQKCTISFLSNKYKKIFYIDTIFVNLKIKNNFYAIETSIPPISNLGLSYLNLKIQYGSLIQENQYFYQVLHQENFKKNVEILYSREFAKEKSFFSFLFINSLISPIEDSEWWVKKYKTYKKLIKSNEYFSYVGVCSAKICESDGGFYFSHGLIYYDKNLKSYFAQEILFSEL